MTRLILEEGGKRRAFKVGDGVITIGSGAHAALKLTGAGVAELHAELVIHGGQVTLKPKPGVLPPKLAGRSLTNDAIVTPGVPIKIGDATLTVEPPEGLAAVAAKVKPKAIEKEDWQRSNRELYKSSGIKPAHMLILLVPLGIVGFFLFKKGVEQPPPASLLAQQQYFHALDMYKSGVIEAAQADLAKIPADAEISPELRANIDTLAAQLVAAKQAGDLAAENDLGTKFFETQLKSFEQTRLQGKIDRPAARVFLKRIEEFEKRWPKHPQIEWTQRMKASYGVMVDMSLPATYADIEFEVKALTWANPKDYKQAFGILKRFIDGGQADERAKALVLVDQLMKERKDWYEDRTQQAKFEYERNQVGKAVNWLLVLATYTGDEEMERVAAERLLDVPRLDEHLRGYRSSRPDWWPQITANKTIADWIARNPLDQ